MSDPGVIFRLFERLYEAMGELDRNLDHDQEDE